MGRTIILFVCAVGLLLPVLSPLALPAASNHERYYTGPKTVYEDMNTSAPNELQRDGSNGALLVDKWAVVIGISDYQGTQNDLLYPDDDARDMYNYLLTKGYPQSHIRLLLDRKATANAIISAIDWMNTQERSATSECVFFYSGHGTTYNGYNDGDNEYTDEAIVSTNLYLILDGQLRQKFANFNSHKILFVFDSCFSGGMDDLAATGRVIDTACSETQYSWDGNAAMQNGVFTYYYMQGLATYNTAEGAQAYATPLAHNAVLAMYGAQMDPQQYDNYTGTWQF